MVSDKEIIEEFERQIAEGKELEGYVPIKARTPKNPTVSYGVSLSPDEFREFNKAAESRGMTLAEFMRSATRGAIAGEIDAEKVAALSSAREKARELSEALSKL